MILRLHLLLLTVIVSFPALSQKGPEDYFSEARGAQNNQNYSVALANYMYIVEKHPTNHLCPSAYWAIAEIYEEQEREADVITVCRKIIYFAMANRMGKPGTAYDFNFEGNRAARRLCDFHEKNGNYDSASYYLGIYDTVLRANLGCGFGEDQVEVMRYADLYVKANRIRDAEKVLIVNTAYDAYGISERLSELFMKYENPVKLKSEIETGINNYFLDTAIINDRDHIDTVIYCNISFLGLKLKPTYKFLGCIGTAEENDENTKGLSERENVIAHLKKLELYRLIEKL